VEFLLLKRTTGLTFQALVKPARLKIGEEVRIDNSSVTARLSAKDKVTFNALSPGEIYALGVMPLPPYIKREPEPQDREYYQTVYARQEGAVASPTAGLHFTKSLLQDVRSRGVNVAYLTLHVGHATFKPVKVDDITKHEMDNESFSIPDETVGLIEKTRQAQGRIIACGTTSCRALETLGQGRHFGETNLFIYPGFQFTMTDCLLTNFHLPRTTLFMLVGAFASEALAKQAYRVAVEKKYRFYSYGDAMLIV
jgi:S-adenosylmethionine:tRNA ribosyltransferase-isomerase